MNATLGLPLDKGLWTSDQRLGLALAYPIYVFFDPGSLPVGNIYEFAKGETLLVEIECFTDASRPKCAPLFAKIPIYYDRDCS